MRENFSHKGLPGTEWKRLPYKVSESDSFCESSKFSFHHWLSFLCLDNQLKHNGKVIMESDELKIEKTESLYLILSTTLYTFKL